LVFKPHAEIVKSTLPPPFRNVKYQNVRHIIDCTEVFIEKPNNLQTAAQTWSDYKHHHTGKILVSITPAGMFNFVSKSWGGRTSDKHITLHSGFLDLIEPYDKVMADRGFQIREDLALLNAELLIPPWVKRSIPDVCLGCYGHKRNSKSENTRRSSHKEDEMFQDTKV